MIEDFREIFRIYAQYTGSGIVMILFFAGLIYTAVSIKKRSIQTVLVITSSVLLAVIFCPPGFELYDRFGGADSYWRLWWIMPIGLGLGYVGCDLIKDHRIAGFALLLVVLLLGGEFVYTGEIEGLRSEAVNAGQLPEDTLATVDLLRAVSDEKEIHAAFPGELLPYVRQYDADIIMPYGYETVRKDYPVKNEFFDVMSDEMTDFERLAELCSETGTRYLFIPNEYRTKHPFGHYGFRKVSGTAGFTLYEYRLLGVKGVKGGVKGDGSQ